MIVNFDGIVRLVFANSIISTWNIKNSVWISHTVAVLTRTRESDLTIVVDFGIKRVNAFLTELWFLGANAAHNWNNQLSFFPYCLNRV